MGGYAGAGSVRRLSAVRWWITLKIVWAWIFTIPVTALLAGGIYYVVELFIS